MKQRVFVIHLITTLDVGGSEMMLYRLLKHMDKSRFESRVISLASPGPVGEMIADLGIPVDSLEMERGQPSLKALLSLVSMLKELKPAILQTWLYHADLLGLFAGKLAGVPNILWNVRSSNMDMTQYRRLSGWVVRACATLSGFPQGVVINSNAGRLYHQKIGYRPSKWQLIPNGVDVQRFKPDPISRQALRKEWNIAEDDLVIGYVARFDPMKDHRTFLHAASQLVRRYDNVDFVLCGAGIDWDNVDLVSVIESLGLRSKVHLLGSRSDVERVFSAMDIATSSSLSEGFPNTIAEAMACGASVVSTAAGDAAEIVGDTGVIVPSGRPDELAAGWLRMIEAGTDNLQDYGNRARQQIAENHSLEVMVTTYEEFYGELAIPE